MVFCIGDTCVNVILNRSCLHSFAHTSSFPYLHRKHRWTIAIWALEHSYKLINRQFYFHSSDRMLSWHFERENDFVFRTLFKVGYTYTLHENSNRIFFSCTVYHCSRWLENIQIKQWIRGKKNQFTQRRWRQWQHANRPCFPSMRKAYNLMTSRNRVNAAIPSAWVLYRATVMDHLNATRSNKESTSRFADDMPLPNLLQNSFWSYTFESIDTQLRILAKLIAITMLQILDCWISSNCNL